MTDSWRPRKLEPGLEQTYSIPSDLMTSTMKSEPERVSVRTSSFAGVPISASAGRGGGGALRASICCAREAVGLAANAAAPMAALLRNTRRAMELALGEPFLDLRTDYTSAVATNAFISHARDCRYREPFLPVQDASRSFP